MTVRGLAAFGDGTAPRHVPMRWTSALLVRSRELREQGIAGAAVGCRRRVTLMSS